MPHPRGDRGDEDRARGDRDAPGRRGERRRVRPPRARRRPGVYLPRRVQGHVRRGAARRADGPRRRDQREGPGSPRARD